MFVREPPRERSPHQSIGMRVWNPAEGGLDAAGGAAVGVVAALSGR